MTINTYDQDQLVRLTAPLTVDGIATDPSTLTLRVKDPTGVTTTTTLASNPALQKDSVGNYHCDVAATIAGLWSYHWESTGAVTSAYDGQFFVTASLA